MRASSLSFIWLTCLPFSRYDPLPGVSRQPIRFISVDLPDPEGPMMATFSPASIEIDTPCSAWISSDPMTYVFHKSTVSIMAISLEYVAPLARVPSVADRTLGDVSFHQPPYSSS